MNYKESEKLELKEKLGSSLAKEIVAFLNTEGGTILIGVNDFGKIKGIDNLDFSMRKISDIITDQISPRCSSFVSQKHFSENGLDLIQIDVLKGDKLFYIKKYGMSENGCYIRNGTSCKSLTPEEIVNRYVSFLMIPEKDITEIPSSYKHLTFKILKNYLLSNNVHINEETFLENLHLLTPDGKYNYLGEILADKNDISINVATFDSVDKSKYVGREEFGGKCLLLAMEQAKNYVTSLNKTFVEVGQIPRKERKLFDQEAFDQAWINACVHNKWTESDHPGIYIYKDRIDIESFGGIPKVLTKEQFIKGKSAPVNKRLFDIFKSCHFAEESGFGVPSIVRAYGESAYEFSENFIDVILKFQRTTREKYDTITEKSDVNARSQRKPIKNEIIELLSNNPYLSRKELSVIIGVTEGSIRHHLNKLHESGTIERVGPDKGGYWLTKAKG